MVDIAKMYVTLDRIVELLKDMDYEMAIPILCCVVETKAKEAGKDIFDVAEELKNVIVEVNSSLGTI